MEITKIPAAKRHRPWDGIDRVYQNPPVSERKKQKEHGELCIIRGRDYADKKVNGLLNSIIPKWEEGVAGRFAKTKNIRCNYRNLAAHLYLHSNNVQIIRDIDCAVMGTTGGRTLEEAKANAEKLLLQIGGQA